MTAVSTILTKFPRVKATMDSIMKGNAIRSTTGKVWLPGKSKAINTSTGNKTIPVNKVVVSP